MNNYFGFGWKETERPGGGLASGASDLFQLGLLAFPAARPGGSAKGNAAARPLRDWFSDAGILICRPASSSPGVLAAALKGGHNAEHHNHNDVGSYVVALGKETPLVDPGSEVYTARTFSAHRYDSKVLNSFGHPVPRVAGKLQREGRAAQAKVLKTQFSDQRDTLVLDIRSCYDVKGLNKLERTFVFSREGAGELSVTDEASLATPQTFETALITFSKWRRAGPRRIHVGEGAAAVEIDIDTQGEEFQIIAEEIHEDLPGKRIPTRIGIALARPVKAAAVRLVIRPAAAARSERSRHGSE